MLDGGGKCKYILKVHLTVFASILDIWYQRKEKDKKDPQIFDSSNKNGRVVIC